MFNVILKQLRFVFKIKSSEVIKLYFIRIENNKKNKIKGKSDVAIIFFVEISNFMIKKK